MGSEPDRGTTEAVETEEGASESDRGTTETDVVRVATDNPSNGVGHGPFHWVLQRTTHPTAWGFLGSDRGHKKETDDFTGAE